MLFVDRLERAFSCSNNKHNNNNNHRVNLHLHLNGAAITLDNVRLLKERLESHRRGNPSAAVHRLALMDCCLANEQVEQELIALVSNFGLEVVDVSGCANLPLGSVASLVRQSSSSLKELSFSTTSRIEGLAEVLAECRGLERLCVTQKLEKLQEAPEEDDDSQLEERKAARELTQLSKLSFLRWQFQHGTDPALEVLVHQAVLPMATRSCGSSLQHFELELVGDGGGRGATLTHQSLPTLTRLLQGLSSSTFTVSLALEECPGLFAHARQEQVHELWTALRRMRAQLGFLSLERTALHPQQHLPLLFQALEHVRGEEPFFYLRERQIFCGSSTTAKGATSGNPALEQFLKSLPRMKALDGIGIEESGGSGQSSSSTTTAWNAQDDERLVAALHRNPRVKLCWIDVHGADRLASDNEDDTENRCKRIMARNVILQRVKGFASKQQRRCCQSSSGGALWAHAMATSAKEAREFHADPIHWILRHHLLNRLWDH